MATTTLTAEQQAAWDNLQSTTLGAVQGLASVAGSTVVKSVTAIAEPLQAINEATPSLLGRPMTSIFNDNVGQPVIASLNNIPASYNQMKGEMQDAAMVVGGIAQNVPLNLFAVAPAMSRFMTNGGSEQTNNFFQNLASKFNPAAIGGSILQQTATPDALLDTFAANDKFKTPEGQKFLEIARNDPAFAKALHDAIIKDPTVAPGLLGGGEGGEFDINELVTSLQDDSTRSKFTGVLTAVAKSPNDNLNFKYMQDVAKAAKRLGAQDVAPEDYKKMQELLKRAGISDLGLDFAADPMGMIGQIFQNPVEFFQKLAGMITATGPIADDMRGVIGGMGQYMEIILGGENGYREFANTQIGPRINELVADAPNFMAQMGMSGEAVPVQATAGTVASVTPTATYGLNQNVGYTPVFTQQDLDTAAIRTGTNNGIDTSGLVGAEENITAKESLASKFSAAALDEQPKPTELRIPAPANIPSPAEMRMQGLGL